MRTNKRNQMMNEQRQATARKRSAERKIRNEKRAVERKADDLVRREECSPAGRKAAETLKAKRRIVREKEHANHQKRSARASSRMGGRRKQIRAELQDRLEA
jgi:hypothetical protein